MLMQLNWSSVNLNLNVNMNLKLILLLFVAGVWCLWKGWRFCRRRRLVRTVTTAPQATRTPSPTQPRDTPTMQPSTASTSCSEGQCQHRIHLFFFCLPFWDESISLALFISCNPHQSFKIAQVYRVFKLNSVSSERSKRSNDFKKNRTRRISIFFIFKK